MKLKYILLALLLLSFFKSNSQILTQVSGGIPTSSGIYSGSVVYNNEIYTADSWNIYKWNGSTWINLGINVDYAILCMCVYHNELYVGGWFENFNGVAINRIIRYNGSTWQPCGNGIIIPANQTGGVEKLIEYNGELIAIGGFIQAGSTSANGIARWNGTTWNTLGSGGFTGLASDPAMIVYNGELYVFSLFISAGGVPARNVAKWNGATWSAVGTGIQHWPRSAAIYNGELYAGLWISQGDSSSMIVKWNGSNWVDVENHLSDTSWNIVSGLTVFNNCLYATGMIDTIDGIAATNIVRYDGQWHPVGNGVSGTGNFFTVLNNVLYLTGDFIYSGALAVNNVVKFTNPPNCITEVQNNETENNFIEIYPNPALNEIHIKKNFDYHVSKGFSIYNFSGALIESKNALPDVIDIRDLTSGIYFLTISINGKYQALKFTK